ncbi:MAG TPA: DUF6702 family protein [Flavobacterium sp.]|jgi:hypothetical protein
MKKPAAVLIFLVFAMSSFTAHKFYVAIFQMNYASDKKSLEITSRIFVDDLNDAFKERYKRKFEFEQQNVPTEDLDLLKKYFKDNLIINVNDKPQHLNLISLEMESNVLICYISVKNVPRVKSLRIKNEILADYVTEQQNIIQTNINGTKRNLLLTAENTSGVLNF